MFLLTYVLKKYGEICVFFKNSNDTQIQNIINDLNKKKNDLEFDFKQKEELRLELLNNRNQIKALKDILSYQKQIHTYNTNVLKKKFKKLKSDLNKDIFKVNETLNKNSKQLSSNNRKINAYIKLKQHKFVKNLKN